MKTCGHNASQAPLAPKGFVTGAEYKWGTIYTGFADLLGKGQPLPNITFGGYDKDMVQNTPYGAGATDKARKAADAAIADLKAGKPIFTKPRQGQQGQGRAAQRALRQLRRAAQQHDLPGRGRDRLDHAEPTRRARAGSGTCRCR